MTTPHVGFDGPPALVPGELRGYRRFRLAPDGLHPTVHAAGGPWSGTVERAVCAAGEEHDAPARGCGCGLYGWYSPSDAGAASGYGDTAAVVAARGRSILGDAGFRSAGARVQAVALPFRMRVQPRAATRARAMLAARYPDAAVYTSRRAMHRDHPPADLTALGIQVRTDLSWRYRRAALLIWLVGVVALYAIAALPRGALLDARTPLWVSGLTVFVLWQAALVWLVTRCTAGSATRRGGTGAGPAGGGPPG